jgi:hypothetical protein
MLFEPVELELDRKRKFKLNIRALMRAEREINRRRGAEIDAFVPIDALIADCIDSEKETVKVPLDLLSVLLWAGLSDDDAMLSIDQIPDLLETSPLSRSQLVATIYEHWIKVTSKGKSETPAEETVNGADKSPLAQRPGSTSGPLQ